MYLDTSTFRQYYSLDPSIEHNVNEDTSSEHMNQSAVFTGTVLVVTLAVGLLLPWLPDAVPCWHIYLWFRPIVSCNAVLAGVVMERYHQQPGLGMDSLPASTHPQLTATSLASSRTLEAASVLSPRRWLFRGTPTQHKQLSGAWRYNPAAVQWKHFERRQKSSSLSTRYLRRH